MAPEHAGHVTPDLDQLAREVVPGSGILSIRPLSVGLLSETFQVIRDDAVYALRITCDPAPALGLNPGWEAQVLNVAGGVGLAPALAHYDAQRGILVSCWVDGRSWAAQEAVQPANIRRMACLLRRVHALPIPKPAWVMNPNSWADLYEAALSRLCGGRKRELQSSAAARLDALSRLPQAAGVLCHSDLHTLNVLECGASLILLDWEYAHVADPLWDLAGWSANNDLAADSRRDLLCEYLAQAPTAEQWSRLELLIWLYDYICLLWSELFLALKPGAGSAIAQRARQLDARLRTRHTIALNRSHRGSNGGFDGADDCGRS
jgi:thiamine kinase-like enzyme